MIERTFDAAWFNGICNLPECRPWLGGTGPIDTTPVISNPNNYALRAKHGGFILIAHGAGIYSVHSQFSSEGRGAHAIEAMRAGLEYMFTRTDCMRIFSHCPDNNPAALALAIKGGAKRWFRKAHDELLGPGQVVAWDCLDWAVSGACADAGEDFHDTLEAAKEAAGSQLPKHEDDPAHNSMVGAAVLMAKRGQPEKAVNNYNAWCAAAGYMPITLISAAPPVIDVGDAIMGLDAQGELQVLSVAMEA